MLECKGGHEGLHTTGEERGSGWAPFVPLACYREITMSSNVRDATARVLTCGTDKGQRLAARAVEGDALDNGGFNVVGK